MPVLWHFALQLYDATNDVWVPAASMAVSREGLQLLPLRAGQCIGVQCVGAAGGAIALGVRLQLIADPVCTRSTLCRRSVNVHVC
jgi:hypothetical protein